MTSEDEQPPETTPFTDWGAVHIPHYRLTPAILPAPNASWSVLVHVAHTFDGYQVATGSDELPNLVNDTLRAYTERDELPQGLTRLRTALFGMQRWDYMGGGYGWGPGAELRYIHALVEGIRGHVLTGGHLQPDGSTQVGVEDKAFNAFDRLVEAYAHWGGYLYHGWTDFPDVRNFQGPTIWSERDCGLRFALELEREWPEMVHMEFAIGKASRADFAPPEKAQRVDLAISDLAGFLEDEDSQERFRTHRHTAFFEVKWLLKGWSGQRFEMDAVKRAGSVQTDVDKLANHFAKGRCAVAGMLVVDDEDYLFEKSGETNWPDGVWRLVVGPSSLRRRGLAPI